VGNLASACNQTVDFLVKHGLFRTFERDGPYTPPHTLSQPLFNKDQMTVMHHANLRGPLYADASGWQLAYRLVKSFCRSGAHDGFCRFDDALGKVEAPLDHVMGELPGAFARLGFNLAGPAFPDGRKALFRATEGSRTDDLPEPYGKWLQHKKLDARWGKPVELEVQMLCTLSSPAVGITHLQVEASTFALPVLVRLRKNLSTQLGLAVPLSTTFSHLRTRTVFELRGHPIDLTHLKD
jgi:hypothetical protein